VEHVSPLLGLYAAVTRQDLNGEPPGGWLPDQRLTLEEALEAFTAGSAFAEFAEEHRGMLRTGMQCDVSVFDRDLPQIPPREIADAHVLATIVGGKLAYAP
jgi:predicted amidohydrolase YtcJ